MINGYSGEWCHKLSRMTREFSTDYSTVVCGGSESGDFYLSIIQLNRPFKLLVTTQQDGGILA